MAERTALRSGADMRGHELRYRLAAGFLEPGDVVVDAACGTGYGADILLSVPQVVYVGVDRDLSDLEVERTGPGRGWVQTDLEYPQAITGHDVFVGFETMEHLWDFRAWVCMARRARRWILFSVPTVPTTRTNPHHRHDFRPGEAPGHLLAGGGWSLWQTLAQPSELSEIYVLKRD